MRVLVPKLLRDLLLGLIAVGLLLGAFQCLWAKVTERIIGQLAPLFNSLGGQGGLGFQEVASKLFEGPGRVLRTLIGGERLNLENAMDVLSIGYVHPLMQVIFCIWAIGRAAGAIAGEIDRGTMELLLAQPLARWRLVLAHLCIDLITIPVLCLSLWAGNWVGAWLIDPIQVETPEIKTPLPKRNYLIEMGLFKVRLEDPFAGEGNASLSGGPGSHDRLQIRPVEFGRALWLVGGLIFAVCGATMWLSACGRFRWRVLGLAVFLTLLQFLVNLIGQMWETVAALRPLTIFYYYQPQQVILGQGWDVTLSEWNGGQPLCHVPMPLVLYGVGLLGYGFALLTFTRRDLPAPL
jgi:ABC-2 type transport system permease protein